MDGWVEDQWLVCSISLTIQFSVYSTNKQDIDPQAVADVLYEKLHLKSIWMLRVGPNLNHYITSNENEKLWFSPWRCMFPVLLSCSLWDCFLLSNSEEYDKQHFTSLELCKSWVTFTLVFSTDHIYSSFPCELWHSTNLNMNCISHFFFLLCHPVVWQACNEKLRSKVYLQNYSKNQQVLRSRIIFFVWIICCWRWSLYGIWWKDKSKLTFPWCQHSANYRWEW